MKNITASSSIFNVDIDVSHRYIVVATYDRKVHIYRVSDGQKERCFQLDSNRIRLMKQGRPSSAASSTSSHRDDLTGSGYPKVAIDPSGIFAAVSYSPSSTSKHDNHATNEKQVHLIHIFTGKSYTNVPTMVQDSVASFGATGHSGVITDVKWLGVDRLVTTSTDGCIFCWRVTNQNIVEEIQQRLSTLQTLGTIPRQREVAPLHALSPVSPLVGIPKKMAYVPNKLPLWAQKKLNIVGMEPLSPPEAPKGKWAERLPKEPVALHHTQEWLKAGGLTSPPMLRFDGSWVRHKWRKYYFDDANENDASSQDSVDEDEELIFATSTEDAPEPLSDPRKALAVESDSATGDTKAESTKFEVIVSPTGGTMKFDLDVHSEIVSEEDFERDRIDMTNDQDREPVDFYQDLEKPIANTHDESKTATSFETMVFAESEISPLAVLLKEAQLRSAASASSTITSALSPAVPSSSQGSPTRSHRETTPSPNQQARARRRNQSNPSRMSEGASGTNDSSAEANKGPGETNEGTSATSVRHQWNDAEESLTSVAKQFDTLSEDDKTFLLDRWSKLVASVSYTLRK